VFFNLLAAAEPSSNFCVAHGTLDSDPSVYPTSCNKPDGWKCHIYVLFLCFSGTPSSHLRNPEVPRNPGWKTLIYSRVERIPHLFDC